MCGLQVIVGDEFSFQSSGVLAALAVDAGLVAVAADIHVAPATSTAGRRVLESPPVGTLVYDVVLDMYVCRNAEVRD